MTLKMNWKKYYVLFSEMVYLQKYFIIHFRITIPPTAASDKRKMVNLQKRVAAQLLEE